MNNIEKLLEGVEVEWVRISDSLVRTKGTSITAGQMKELHKDGAPLKIFAGGKTIAFFDYVDIPLKDINREPSIIVKSRGVIEFEYYDKPFSHKNEMWSYHSKDENINIKFVYYFLKIQEPYFQNIACRMQMPQISIPDTEKFKVPIPPLSVQNEIVRILDAFTEHTETLINELTTELEARKKQYNYYREKLLSFEEGQNSCLNQDLQDSQNFQDKVEWKTLGEVAEIGTGSHNTQDAEDDGEYTFYARGITPLKLNSYDFEETAIITAGDGVGVGKVFHWVVGKYALHQRAYRIVPNEKEIYPRFVYHYIVAKFYLYIEKTSVSSSVTSMRKPMFLKFPIPVPSLKEQTRIVAILDKLDSLTASISEALPKEIALRKKQYEYYRDRLLTFK